MYIYYYEFDHLVKGTWKHHRGLTPERERKKIGHTYAGGKNIIKYTELIMIAWNNEIIYDKIWSKHPRKYQDEILHAINVCSENGLSENTMELLRLAHELGIDTAPSPSFRL